MSYHVGIVGYKQQTVNYERMVQQAGMIPNTSICETHIYSCDLLLLPGGGDINPLFYGQNNRGSHTIDTNLDILQLSCFDHFVSTGKPILGICKGMQLINVALGGTLHQDIRSKELHQKKNGDILHNTVLTHCYPTYSYAVQNLPVNSCHHQSVDRLGDGLIVFQESVPDHCIEGLYHSTLPIIGLQWHPERLAPDSQTFSQELAQTRIWSEQLLPYLASFVPSSHLAGSLSP